MPQGLLIPFLELLIKVFLIDDKSFQRKNQHIEQKKNRTENPER